MTSDAETKGYEPDAVPGKGSVRLSIGGMGLEGSPAKVQGAPAIQRATIRLWYKTRGMTRMFNG
jgi:hypothetical protein